MNIQFKYGFAFLLLTTFESVSCANSVRTVFNLSLPVLNPSVQPKFQPGPRWSGPVIPLKKYMALRVMTLNTFHAGVAVENGVIKMAKHINLVNPDIVTLQEINQAGADALLTQMGSQWIQCSMPQTYWLDSAIITKKSIAKKYTSVEGFSNIGCQIQIADNPKTYVNVWNIHLNFRDYGPYKACIQPVAGNVKELLSKEYSSPYPGLISRVDSIVNLLNHPPFLNNRFNTGQEPLILTGDFNVPSALDWTDPTKGRHCNWVVEWPVSRILMDNGFVDSYRKVYPNPLTQPGITWSPVNFYYDPNKAYLEPQDRIDFIYYRSSKMSAVSSRTYVGTQPIHYLPNNYRNDWPSDHAAVITDFDISL